MLNDVSVSSNVFYDRASDHQWRDLNETVFLERVMARLEGALGEAFSRYTFFILSSHDPDVRPASLTDESPRKVLIFISDESASIPRALQPHYLAIFKSYLREEPPDANVFPFSPGYVRDVPAYPVKPIADRAINVFFSGHLTLNRLPLYRSLHPVYRRLPGIAFRAGFSLFSRGFGDWLIPHDLNRTFPRSHLQFTSGFKGGLSPSEYGRRLADSRIALCPKGARGPETFRHVEATRAGAVVISERLPDTHLYRGAPFVMVDDWEAGARQAMHLLQDETTLHDLHQATLGWWRDVFSEEATANYMCARLEAVERP